MCLLADILVVVKAESVHVYCNPINYPLLLPRIAHWRNLRVHCLDKELVLCVFVLIIIIIIVIIIIITTIISI